MIPAIVLSAGKSERMGSPKALLSRDGTTFLDSVLSSVRASTLDGVIVVLGHHRKEILRAIDLECWGFDLGRWVFNEDYEQGMTTSFQAGIRQVPDEALGAMLFLVDHPAPDARTIDALVAEFRPGHIVVPLFENRRGHPVLFSREVLDEIAILPPDRGANSVVRAQPDRVIQVSVSDPAVLTDIDTPEDFNRWIENREAR